ncbi:MAG: Blue-light-activated protein [Polyangiaceae bacterium]|jgi:CheY-like chemotaxis protein|nr:Blue-light-activated protein [Polyangiaceae bacterium]
MKVPGAVRSEEIRALFEQGGAVLGANVTVGAVVVGTLWGSVPESRLVSWYGAMLLMCGARAVFQRRFRDTRPPDVEVAAWGRRFVFGSTVAGALWGTAALLFFAPGNLRAQGLLTLAIGGMTAAAAGTLACHLPAFFGFFVPALSPLIVATLVEGGRFHYGMAAILLAYAVGMGRVARGNHRAYARALQLGIANTELLEALSASESELREANRTLENRVVERTKTLERQSEALRRAQRLEVAGRLAGNLAHDFNSLLTVVINNASQLEASSALSPQQRLAAAETLEAGKRGAALIRQLLALSRRKQPEPRALSLNELAREWAELFPRVLGEAVEVELELAPSVPHVTADPGYVEQALLNLVLGTRPATKRAGKLKLSTHEAAPGSSTVELWVEQSLPADEGSPVRSESPYLTFDADVRSRSVGFTSVWSTAEQWGGSVHVDPHAFGVRCRLLFPAVTADAPPAATERGETRDAPRGATVLVVDDEPTLRAVMRRALARDGHHVLVAEDGARALKVAAGHPTAIDLLLTDVVMPGISGLELARKLTLERPGLAVLYVSGFTFQEAVPPTDLAQGVAYLPKPFDTGVLTAKVRELLTARRAQRPVAVNAGS